MLGESKDPSKQRLGAKEELARAQFGLGLALSEAGKLPEAIAHYRKALEIKPDYAERTHQPGHCAWPAAARSTRRSTITGRP